MEPTVNDELEVTVLGRGVGESVVVHVADGRWIIVDSFIDDETGRPGPLVYLESLGVDVATQVTAVVLTHLHRDHYLGIGVVVTECEDAWFYLPAVMPQERWEAVLAFAQASPSDRTTRLGHVANAYTVAKSRSRVKVTGDDGEIETNRENAIQAIGPTSAAIADGGLTGDPINDVFIDRLARKLNYTSTVLWIKVGDARAMLGADLDSEDSRFGWAALLKEQSNKPWLTGASLVKVPHHGSAYAHTAAVYEAWTTSPVAVVTGNWNAKLPDEGLVDRLAPHCSAIYHTNARHDQRAQDTRVDEMSVGTVAVMGAVTARRQPTAESWTVSEPQEPAWQEFP